MTEGKKIRRPAAWLACLALAAAPGCAWLRPAGRPNLAPHAQGVWPVFPPRLEPRLMMRLVQMHDERLRTLKCRAAVRVEGQGSFKAIVRCRRPQRQLYVLGSKVGVTLFHLWANGPRLVLYAVQDNAAYAGDLDDALVVRRPRSPAATIRVLRDAFLNPVRVDSSDEIVATDHLRYPELVCVRVKRGGATRECFVLERRRLLVAERTIFDKRSGLVVGVSYSDYRRFDAVWLPLKIRVRIVAGDGTGFAPLLASGAALRAAAEITLSRAEVNQPINPMVFDARRRLPRAVPVHPLRDLEARQ